jgi:hypothetical protein
MGIRAISPPRPIWHQAWTRSPHSSQRGIDAQHGLVGRHSHSPAASARRSSSGAARAGSPDGYGGGRYPARVGRLGGPGVAPFSPGACPSRATHRGPGWPTRPARSPRAHARLRGVCRPGAIGARTCAARGALSGRRPARRLDCQLLESATFLAALLLDQPREPVAVDEGAGTGLAEVGPLVGVSEAMQALRERVERVAARTSRC